MNILMFIFITIYLAGVIIGHHINMLNDSTYFICLGLWAIMFILSKILGEHDERW